MYSTAATSGMMKRDIKGTVQPKEERSATAVAFLGHVVVDSKMTDPSRS